jgi:transcription factor MYB, plant
LKQAVKIHEHKNWKRVAEHLPGKTEVQCLHRWTKVLDPDLTKGPWSEEEDGKVRQLVAVYGAKKWSKIAAELPGRIGKQCRERWHNHLNPDINKKPWTLEEDKKIILVSGLSLSLSSHLKNLFLCAAILGSWTIGKQMG